MIGPGAETGDQPELASCPLDQFAIDPVGDRGNQHVAAANGLGQRFTREGFVLGVEPRVEQFAKARLHLRQQAAGDHHARSAVEAAGGAVGRVGHLPFGLVAGVAEGQAPD